MCKLYVKRLKTKNYYKGFTKSIYLPRCDNCKHIQR